MGIELAKLCAGIIDFPQPQSTLVIEQLSLDSRQVKPGSLFFAYPGTHTDGRQYIDKALQQGAAAICYETADQFKPEIALEYQQVPLIPVPHLQQIIGYIAERFYAQPTQKMQVFGITGTNGKSSCSLFLAAALHNAQQPVAMLGTIGNGIFGALQESTHTTLDAIALQQTMAEFYRQGVTHVAMEVSSHALCQGRVNGVQFNTAIFTNLTHDHLDYHGDFTHYAAAKRKLFCFPSLKAAIINADDPYGLHWLQELNGKLPVCGYSLNPKVAKAANWPMVYAQHISLSMQGITAEIQTPWGAGILQAKQIGRFNLSNLLAVLATLGAHGMPLAEILTKLSQLPQVPGRMETYGGGKLPTVVVDYAHTPDALKQVLLTLRECCQGQLWCIVGCGGNRDKTKRPIMGQYAEQHADHVILTDDNPRQEAPKQIVADMLQGMRSPQIAIIEHHRERAIAHAINCANAKDVILVAGKGHENYQIIGEQKLLFSDALTVQRLLAEKRGIDEQ